MRLDELWAEVKELPHSLAYPLHEDGWWTRHALPHLVGGVVLYALGLLFGANGLLFAAVYTVARQELCREVKGPREFPLYAMAWDSCTSITAAACAALLCREVWP